MVPASRVDGTDEQIGNLVSVCNQPLIYDVLFRKALGDAPYDAEHARGFLTWARAGWESNSHFVFLLVDPSGLVAGALDIKSADRNGAEIGYWCSSEHRGLMVNSVRELLEFARRHGFACLWARVDPLNAGSKRVLELNGFHVVGECPDHPNRIRYERPL
jgi:RimJ/RimL family protein N-acetyltransferase